MNTPAHMALGLALLGRKANRREWAFILCGAVLPDLFLYIRHLGGSTGEILVPLFNGVPLYGLSLLVGLGFGMRWLTLLSGSALLHIFTDLPLHAEDARRHFFPLSDWTYRSPVSFWNVNHHGKVFGILEGALFLLCWVLIWRRLETQWGRLLMVGFLGIYLLTFTHFWGHAFANAHWAPW